MLYGQDWEDRLPTDGNEFLTFANSDYVGKNSRLFRCPADKKNPIPTGPLTNTDLNTNDSVFMSYYFINEGITLGSDKVSFKSNHPSAIGTVYDLFGGTNAGSSAIARNHNDDGGNAVFLDGHVEFLQRNKWDKPNAPWDPGMH